MIPFLINIVSIWIINFIKTGLSIMLPIPGGVLYSGITSDSMNADNGKVKLWNWSPSKCFFTHKSINLVQKDVRAGFVSWLALPKHSSVTLILLSSFIRK